MKSGASRHVMLFCCGLCVICASTLVPWLYYMGWLDAVLPPSARARDVAIVKPSETRTTDASR